MRHLLSAIVIALSSPAGADGADIRAIVVGHILPGYQILATEAADLAATAASECAPNSPDLIADFNTAFDAWVSVSHLRFGPSEQQDRAFALAFWPDTRGSIPKALATLLGDQDPAVSDPDAFAEVSIAARGFYALEFLLFDPQFAPGDNPEYHCALVQAITGDIALISAAIHDDWRGGYGDVMSDAGNDTYRTPTEAAQQLFTALSTGLEFTANARIGRPLGTFDRPRPNRAEARRSGRSLSHVILSLTATKDLSALMSADSAAVAEAFDTALQRAEALDDPIFAGAADPQGRLRIEVLQQEINDIRQLLAESVGPSLGIAAGFNSLDGD
ncbi:imelysin family protein [uncultured Tateyamaria sp.]|uniref:imelysin family protein n=1 Tax=uncultured Tateyamaria sp. TaxID=455651 RepID=UPI0026236BC3|nr:imelysin family protein [uncultured Tateyamaria sp.]